jgi:hypothetical protein
VAAHAAQINARLKDGSMPCDGGWSPGQPALFQSWIDVLGASAFTPDEPGPRVISPQLRANDHAAVSAAEVERGQARTCPSLENARSKHCEWSGNPGLTRILNIHRHHPGRSRRDS